MTIIAIAGRVVAIKIVIKKRSKDLIPKIKKSEKIGNLFIPKLFYVLETLILFSSTINRK